MLTAKCLDPDWEELKVKLRRVITSNLNIKYKIVPWTFMAVFENVSWKQGKNHKFEESLVKFIFFCLLRLGYYTFVCLQEHLRYL